MPADADSLPAATARVLALQAWLQATEGGPVQLVETHISWVLLTATQAFKLKKPLQLSFVDCATLARRRFCAEEELRLNGRLAPEIYLGLLEVHATPAGPALGDAPGPVVDVAVHMRRFDDAALWSTRVAAGMLRPAHVDALAARLVRFHAEAAVAPADGPRGKPRRLAEVLGRLVDGLDVASQATPLPHWPPLHAWLRQQLAALAPQFEARLQAGRVREGHGDLHLANLLAFDRPTPAATAFDGIDFDPALRWVDVMHDIAFVVMDLLAHGAPALAWRFLDAWLQAGGDHEGLPLLRFHLVSRALVRAQVAVLQAAQGRAGPAGCDMAGYLGLAHRLAFGEDARLALMHGLPASGKSQLAEALLQAAGAVRLRSDVERKRLHGLGPLADSRRAGLDLYGPDAHRRTYARLHALAETALRAGWPVIVDAAFLRRDERLRFIALARSLGMPVALIDCQAPMPVLRRRIAHRLASGGDPSEADEAVLAKLAALAEPLAPDEQALCLPVDTTQPPCPADLAARWQALR
ncbi:MAG: AAA family ATPase [Aquincola tertiaricarbonis]